LIGYTSLPLVPVGVLWLVAGSWRRPAPGQYRFAIAALVMASIAWLLGGVVGALVYGGAAMAVVALALGAYGVRRLLPRLRPLRAAGQPPPATVFYLIVVPVAVLLLQSAWGEQAADASRDRANFYEPSGEAYNLFFEQFSLTLGTREFVMYSPLDAHTIVSHRQDRLRLSSEELEMERGYYAVRDTAHAHWRYFLFD
jgi:hypothetical protein